MGSQKGGRRVDSTLVGFGWVFWKLLFLFSTPSLERYGELGLGDLPLDLNESILGWIRLFLGFSRLFLGLKELIRSALVFCRYAGEGSRIGGGSLMLRSSCLTSLKLAAVSLMDRPMPLGGDSSLISVKIYSKQKL